MEISHVNLTWVHGTPRILKFDHFDLFNFCFPNKTKMPIQCPTCRTQWRAYRDIQMSYTVKMFTINTIYSNWLHIDRELPVDDDGNLCPDLHPTGKIVLQKAIDDLERFQRESLHLEHLAEQMKLIIHQQSVFPCQICSPEQCEALMRKCPLPDIFQISRPTLSRSRLRLDGRSQGQNSSSMPPPGQTMNNAYFDQPEEIIKFHTPEKPAYSLYAEDWACQNDKTAFLALTQNRKSSLKGKRLLITHLTLKTNQLINSFTFDEFDIVRSRDSFQEIIRLTRKLQDNLLQNRQIIENQGLSAQIMKSALCHKCRQNDALDRVTELRRKITNIIINSDFGTDPRNRKGNVAKTLDDSPSIGHIFS